MTTILSEPTVAQLQAELADVKAMLATVIETLARFPRCATPLQYEQRDALEADKCRYRARIDEVTAELHRLGIYTPAEIEALSRAAALAELRVDRIEGQIQRFEAAGTVTTSLQRQLGTAKERMVDVYCPTTVLRPYSFAGERLLPWWLTAPGAFIRPGKLRVLDEVSGNKAF